MRRSRGFEAIRGHAHLFERPGDEPPSFWTEALGDPPEVYRERIQHVGERAVRRWDPGRSKLGAGLAKGWSEPLPVDGERWLYLGAGTGTTPSHVADLVGPTGRVYALERSVRPFARLRQLAGRYPNLLPILADARRPMEYCGLVPPVDGVYADVAQPDQVAIALDNARLFLRGSGSFLLALKTASMGRDREPRQHLAAAVEQLEGIELERPIDLAPYHRRHYLMGGRPTRALFREPAAAPSRRPTDPAPRARRRS
ncbi:MAG: fibrillarin-like rRNA/tRNA 2'-O-methyltransferase [Thermoplasmata archaeon]|nr:fibrillarin-like rRNA/tRNA 2'-O-methyltransferase [Thermoplasmata archaeon]